LEDSSVSPDHLPTISDLVPSSLIFSFLAPNAVKKHAARSPSVNPIDGMYNPGGFTDGDRAACFLTALGARKENIKLLGTRSDIVGRWSGDTEESSKLQKLQWMKSILEIHGLWVV
jgi:uncharacterized Rossmann fold enzyme